VKGLPTGKAGESSCLERFYREARAVAALDHPNIVRVYDIDQEDNLHFLVMEHVDGSSLQEIIKRTGPMDVLRTAHYVRQAALGLQHAHDTAGLVHRDVKPGNVLVDRNGIVKVLDMGLARFFHDEEDDLTNKIDETVLGTAASLPPDQPLDSHSVPGGAWARTRGGWTRGPRATVVSSSEPQRTTARASKQDRARRSRMIPVLWSDEAGRRAGERGEQG